MLTTIRILLLTILMLSIRMANCQTPYYDKTKEGYLVFHPIRVDNQGKIIPWLSDSLGQSYDQIIRAVWNFWDTMRIDMNGLPYYMNHQVWRPNNDPRGIGGDQFSMALSSWQLLYQYTGNERIKENMKFIADYYITHSLSPDVAKWAGIPFPYNTLIYSGVYDGDMVIGKDFTQPDKAGSFGWELLKLYKLSGNKNYLQHAVRIANTLAAHTQGGDERKSPFPFKVNAYTGEIGHLKSNSGNGAIAGASDYTTNMAGTLNLFEGLTQINVGQVASYKKAYEKILSWMKNYPLQNNRWGPFFEDIPGWSDTQINAVTFAQFIMEHQALFPNWKTNVRGILNWVYEKLGNNDWQKYGVKVVNEQTAYQTPGNSHTSRQAAAELLYASLSGDTTERDLAIRQLNWATYMADTDGKNNYPRDEVWLTDGYGDYVRHYLNAMAAMPQLAPSTSNHILHSTSVVSQADYFPDLNKRLSPDVESEEVAKIAIYYRTYDVASTERIRLTSKPVKVTVNKKHIEEVKDKSREGWSWQGLDTGGILHIRHTSGNTITIYSNE